MLHYDLENNALIGLFFHFFIMRYPGVLKIGAIEIRSIGKVVLLLEKPTLLVSLISIYYLLKHEANKVNKERNRF